MSRHIVHQPFDLYPGEQADCEFEVAVEDVPPEGIETKPYRIILTTAPGLQGIRNRFMRWWRGRPI